MKKVLVVLVACLMISNLASLQSQDALTASKERGKELYLGYCVTCHMDQGQGIEGVFPPLAQSDYLMADKERSIQIVKYGQDGEVVVNGVTYNGVMVSMGLSDDEVADVLNYVRNSWGNSGEIVTTDEVKEVE